MFGLSQPEQTGSLPVAERNGSDSKECRILGGSRPVGGARCGQGTRGTGLYRFFKEVRDLWTGAAYRKPGKCNEGKNEGVCSCGSDGHPSF